MPRKYDQELKAKVVRLVVDHVGDYPTEFAAMKVVMGRLGMNGRHSVPN